MTQQTAEPTTSQGGRLVRVFAWVLTVAGLAVFAFGLSYDGWYYNHAHIGLLCSIGAALLVARMVVAVKWHR